MTTQRTTRLLGALVALLLACTGLVLQAPPAQAATHVVTLGGPNDPTPETFTIARGDTVRFTNGGGSGSHKITHTSGSWRFTATVPVNKSVTTPAFAVSGIYGYRDDYTIIAVPQTKSGSIVVAESASSPPPASGAPRPSGTARPAPKPSATQAPSTSGHPVPSPSGAGTAIGPGLGLGSFPSAAPSQGAGPRPNIAGGASGSASPATAGRPQYADKSGVVQSSAHRYGLPAALALVAVTGIASLLVRLLLAQPAARRRRTKTEAPEVVEGP